MARRKKFEKQANPHYQTLLNQGKQPDQARLERLLDEQHGEFWAICEQSFLLTNSPREEGKPYRGVKELFAELNRDKQRLKSAGTLSKYNKIYEAFGIELKASPEDFNQLGARWTVAARAASFVLKRKDQSLEEWFDLALTCSEKDIADRIADLEGKERSELTTISTAVKLMIRRVQAQMLEEFGLRLSQNQVIEFRLAPLLGDSPEDRDLRRAWAEALGETPNPLIAAIEEYLTEGPGAGAEDPLTQKALGRLKKWLKGRVEFKKYELEPAVRFVVAGMTGEEPGGDEGETEDFDDQGEPDNRQFDELGEDEDGSGIE